MTTEIKDKNVKEANKKKMERLKSMREQLAKNMARSNYYFYLEGNINSKGQGRF